MKGTLSRDMGNG